MAREIVKKEWFEQGVWNNKWNQFALGRWKHEEPLELESESETSSEAVPLPRPSFFGPPPKPRPPKLPKTDEQKRQIAEQRVVRQREREASRPYHQFVYYVSKARERIREESANGGGADAADINTSACENVENTWTKRGIWNRRWGILPGMSWKHEEPLDEEAAESSAPLPAHPLLHGSPGARAATAVGFFGRSPFGESYHREPSGALASSQHELPANFGSAGLENGDTRRSSSASNPPSLSLSDRNVHPTMMQARIHNKRMPSPKTGKPANTSLKLVHPSKVSKAAEKRKGPRRPPNISQKVSSTSLPLSTGGDAAGPQPPPLPDGATPRRSKRIRQAISSAAKDPAKKASTAPLKNEIADNLTTKSSAKPQGVSKRQPARITRRKADTLTTRSPAKATRGKARKK